MHTEFDQQVMAEFRANRGRVGGSLERKRLLLLTTTGARSGTQHTVPVGYLPDGPARHVVVATGRGTAAHPGWYHNLVTHSQVTVDTGVMRYEAKANILSGQERDRLFARAVEADPALADQQARTGRVIPVVALDRVAGPPKIDALPGDALKFVHDGFRRELALVRAEVAESGAGLGAQLRVNCLTICQSLHLHHETEDGYIFPGVAESNPELADALARLRQEHEAIAALTGRLKELLAGTGTDPAALRDEVDRLITELESHLDYEEEHLVPVLNASA
jgi:deazaflavin-dependent oxidoreductase (nitroreductase family)